MEMFAVCPLMIWKEKQSILQLRCFSDSRDLYLPSFSTERGGSCFGGTGEGPTCLCESSDGETAAGDGKEGSKIQGRKDKWKRQEITRDQDDVFTYKQHTQEVGAGGCPGLEAACSRFLEKLCVLGAKEDSFSSGRSYETLSRTWSWGLSVCRTGASVCLTA